MRTVTAAQMKRIDRLAQQRYGIPELVLMEHAGTAVAHEVVRRLGTSGGRRGVVLVFSGSGANGGDGFVAARHLDNWGIPVEAVLLGHMERIRGASVTNLEILRHLKVRVTAIEGVAQWNRWVVRWRPVRLIVDALLGTGVSGAVREPVCSAIRWINQRGCPVVSVDLPSGLSSDTGKPCGVAVRATVTVACGFLKVGLTKPGSPAHTGRIRVADISLPRRLVERTQVVG